MYIFAVWTNSIKLKSILLMLVAIYWILRIWVEVHFYCQVTNIFGEMEDPTDIHSGHFEDNNSENDFETVTAPSEESAVIPETQHHEGVHNTPEPEPLIHFEPEKPAPTASYGVQDIPSTEPAATKGTDVKPSPPVAASSCENYFIVFCIVLLTRTIVVHLCAQSGSLKCNLTNVHLLNVHSCWVMNGGHPCSCINSLLPSGVVFNFKGAFDHGPFGKKSESMGLPSLCKH